MRFAIPANDPQIHALVVGLDRDGTSAAETWRQVGAAAWELGLRRPGYHVILRLVRAERLRRAARTAVRAAALGVGASLLTQRVVDLPIALDALDAARRNARLVSERHKPP
jgi:hypothetical protein